MRAPDGARGETERERPRRGRKATRRSGGSLNLIITNRRRVKRERHSESDTVPSTIKYYSRRFRLSLTLTRLETPSCSPSAAVSSRHTHVQFLISHGGSNCLPLSFLEFDARREPSPVKLGDNDQKFLTRETDRGRRPRRNVIQLVPVKD